MKLLLLLAATAALAFAPITQARADDATLARAICYSAALKSDAVDQSGEATYCAEVTSLGQAECLKGALQSDQFHGDERSFCKKAKTRAEGICLAGAIMSKSVPNNRDQELKYCEGVSEPEAVCLSGAFFSDEAEPTKEKDFCKSFSFASEHAAQNATSDPLSLCQAKLDNLSELFSRVSPSWFNRSLKQLKESASQILDHTDRTPPAGAAQTN